MTTGDLCGVCFEIAGECRCASLELGRPIPSSVVPQGMLEAAAGLELELNEDPDNRPYVWDQPEFDPCR